MANTWAAIGRAQPHKYAGELLQNKIAIEQNERQGLLTQSKLALDNVQYQRMQNELTKEKQEQERLSKPVNIKAHPMFLGLSDDMKKRVFDHFFDGGLVDEQGIGTTGDVMFGIQTIEQTTKGLKTILAPAIEEQQGELLQLQTEITEMGLKGGNEKQIEQKKQLLAQKAEQFNQSSIVYKNALEQAQRLELEQAKEKERIKLQGIKDKEDAKAAQLKADALVKSQKLQRENVLEAVRIRSKSGKNADGSPYTVQQKVDDARQFYSLKKASLFEMGMLREGKEDEYDKLMENLAKDLNLVMNGSTPSYLDIKEKPRTVVRTGKHKGKKVVEYSDGSIEYAD